MRQSMTVSSGISIGLLVAVTACGSSSNSAPQNSTNETSAANVVTADSVVETIDYGQQYIDIIAESNCLAEQVTTAMSDLYGRSDGRPTESEWEQVKEPLQATFVPYAKSLTDLGAELERASWPDEVQPAIDDLIAKVVGDALYAEQISQAEDFEEFTAIAQPAYSDASTRVRTQLNLDSYGIDGIDYCEIAGLSN